MALEDLDALLARMDAMAKAANAFTSEAVQKEAFAAMIAVFEGKRHSAPHKSPPHLPPEPQPAEPTDINVTPTQPPAREREKAAKVKTASKDSRGGWKVVKDLNLHPEGKQSFEAFIEEKKPSSNEDKYAAIVYYLKEIVGTNTVTIHQVGTIFRMMKAWKEPTQLAHGLKVVSSRKNTLDTKNLEAIDITPHGRNFVERDLPPKTKV
jgi:hypothetical protein